MGKLKFALLLVGLCLAALALYIAVVPISEELAPLTILIIPAVLIIIIFVGGFIVSLQDRAKRKRKIRDKEIISDSFGDGVATYEYKSDRWQVSPKTPETIMLFDKAYPVSLYFVSGSPADGISERYHEFYEQCKATIAEKREEIEALFEDYYTRYYELSDRQTLLSEFEVHTVEIYPRGQSVLIGGGPEGEGDTDGFALIVNPEFEIMTYEEYFNISQYDDDWK